MEEQTRRKQVNSSLSKTGFKTERQKCNKSLCPVHVHHSINKGKQGKDYRGAGSWGDTYNR